MKPSGCPTCRPAPDGYGNMSWMNILSSGSRHSGHRQAADGVRWCLVDAGLAPQLLPARFDLARELRGVAGAQCRRRRRQGSIQSPDQRKWWPTTRRRVVAVANVIAYLVAAIAALSGLAWILLGIAGWAGSLRRNRYWHPQHGDHAQREGLRRRQPRRRSGPPSRPAYFARGRRVGRVAAWDRRHRPGSDRPLVASGLLDFSGTAIPRCRRTTARRRAVRLQFGGGCGGHDAEADSADGEHAHGDEDICGTRTSCGGCEMRDACFDDETTTDDHTRA